MTDIVERLDNINICMCDYMTRDSSSDCETLDDAKDTITRLRAEIERLRAALEPFACDCAVNERCAVPDNCRNFQVRRILGEKA